MNQGISVIVFPTRDLRLAKDVYSKLLGSEPYVDAPYYLGFRVGGLEIGFDPHGHDEGMTGPVGYFGVDDIGSSLQQLTDAGGRVVQDVKDVGGGKRTATVTDPDGNLIGLVQEP